jgi:chloramphenicol-sensitive protein RarD
MASHADGSVAWRGASDYCRGPSNDPYNNETEAFTERRVRVGDRRESTRAGLFYGIAAYGLWGLMPLYFATVRAVSPGELLAHRIVWCFLLLLGVLTVLRRWPDFLRVVTTRRTVLYLIVSAHLVAANWLIYIYGVYRNDVVQTTLGYFINPLFSILLGLVFFRERLRLSQWIAIALAGAGVAVFVAMVDEFPWIALGVAISFGLYGLVRKVTPVDGLIGLTVETMVLTPVAAICLLWWSTAGTSIFGTESRSLDALIIASGLVTAAPLFCFGQAARRLPLSTLGFLQYMAPTVQFLIALFVFKERFPLEKQISFGLVWAALLFLTMDSILHSRRTPKPPLPADDRIAPAPSRSVACRQ